MARPSSLAPVQLEISWMTLTGDRSPFAISAAPPPRQLKLFDSTPTITPVPVRPNVERAKSARIAKSPWLVTIPASVMAQADCANLRLGSAAAAMRLETGNSPETVRPKGEGAPLGQMGVQRYFLSFSLE
jgi:hypothetical protein